MPDPLEECLDRELEATLTLLERLIVFPSLPGQEQDAMEWLEAAARTAGVEVERIALRDALRDDPEYSSPVEGLKYEARFNLRLLRRGEGNGSAIILNAHVDVVPPSAGMSEPWRARREGDVIAGRGACDDKGQIAVIYLALRTLEAWGAKLKGDIIVHWVVEEENGGNGTLAMIRRGERAQGCIVLEPTDRRIVVAARGAVWFRIVVQGCAGHSGVAQTGRNALQLTQGVMQRLEGCHREILESSRGVEPFTGFVDPMPLTFGKLHAGEWPATTPGEAVLEGVMGFLPNLKAQEVCRRIEAACLDGLDPAEQARIRVGFTFRHDGFTIDPAHPLCQTLQAASRRAGEGFAFGPMLCSSDAWFYDKFLQIPTVLFGAGSLGHAHTATEQIRISEIREAALSLVYFLLEFCGDTAAILTQVFARD